MCESYIGKPIGTRAVPQMYVTDLVKDTRDLPGNVSTGCLEELVAVD